MHSSVGEKLEYLIDSLLSEKSIVGDFKVPGDLSEKKKLMITEKLFLK